MPGAIAGRGRERAEKAASQVTPYAADPRPVRGKLLTRFVQAVLG